MKKLSVLVFLFSMGAMLSFASRDKVVVTKVKHNSEPSKTVITPTNTDIITAQPEGTLLYPVYGISETTWLNYGGAIGAMSNNNGYAVRMVRTETNVYVQNMITEFGNNVAYWVKGDIEADGKVRFKFPQYVYHRDAQGTAAARDYYIARLTPTLTGSNSVEMTVDMDNCDLVMKFEGDNLVQVKEEAPSPALAAYTNMVGLVYDDGSFTAYAEQGIAYKPLTDELVTPPAAAAEKSYSFDYLNGSNEAKAIGITMVDDGNDVYFKGFNTFIPESWVKGVKENENTIVIPTTYMGVYENVLTFLCGLSDDESQLVAPITLTKDGDKWVAGSKMLINIGNEKVDLNDNRVYKNGVLSPVQEGTKTPATPIIDDGEEGTEWSEADGMGALGFIMEAKDTEGNPIDVANLYYNVFMDGNLFTFTKDIYGTPEDITDVPYTFQSDFIFPLGDGYFFVFFFDRCETIGVRAVYKANGEVTYSPTATYSFSASSVDQLKSESPIVSSEYYDMTGRRMAKPCLGVYIQVNRHANGKHSVEKKIMKH